MKLAEVFSQLAYGELSQVVLGEHAEGEVNESHYPALVAHLNLGLTALYTRFNLKEGRVTVPLVPDTLSYPITAPDLLKIERVYTDAGCELGLNDLADSYALSTPSTTVLTVPAEIVAQGNDGHPGPRACGHDRFPSRTRIIGKLGMGDVHYVKWAHQFLCHESRCHKVIIRIARDRPK